jgi:Ni/Fe-hydrogenase subunit HybB-like protein
MSAPAEIAFASRTPARVAAAGAAVGALALALGVATGQARAALASLAASWLFFAGLSAGGVAVAAAIRVARGRWAGPVLPFADAAARFFLPALVLQAALLLGARALLPWVSGAGAGRIAALAARQLLPTLALFLIGRRHVRAAGARGRAGEARATAVAYLVVYAVALSLWAYDWVLSLSESPPATALPALYMVGAFLSGLAFVALAAAIRNAGGPDTRHDLGKLVFAFAVVWSYLVWALYLAAWYGNLPAEAGPLLARWRGPYRLATLAVLAAVLIWPFGLLFPETLKRRRDTLAAGAAAVLAGLWLERFLLVLPSLRIPLTPAAAAVGAGVALGVASAFARFVVLGLSPRAAGSS